MSSSLPKTWLPVTGNLATEIFFGASLAGGLRVPAFLDRAAQDDLVRARKAVAEALDRRVQRSDDSFGEYPGRNVGLNRQGRNAG